MIALAKPDTQDYLWTIRDTLARVSEVNRLTWDDVNLEQRYVVLYTRKKRGGHLTPRKVPLTDRLLGTLSRRYRERDHTKPWVFWHWLRHQENGAQKAGPYQDRRESPEESGDQGGGETLRVSRLAARRRLPHGQRQRAPGVHPAHPGARTPDHHRDLLAQSRGTGAGRHGHLRTGEWGIGPSLT